MVQSLNIHYKTHLLIILSYNHSLEQKHGFPYCIDKQMRIKEMKVKSIHWSREDHLRCLHWDSLQQNAGICTADLR